MLDNYGFETYEENEFPLAYLITIRTYGTWLPGDARHSVDRHWINEYGTPDLPPDRVLREAMKEELNGPPFILQPDHREVADHAIRGLCERREYFLHAINVRSNHAHSVVTAQLKPERIANSFKAEATKKLREGGLVSRDVRIWSRGRSRRYLWKPLHLEAAIHYVLYGQGDVPFEIPD